MNCEPISRSYYPLTSPQDRPRVYEEFFWGGFRGRALERVVKSASAAVLRALALGFFVHLVQPCQDFLALPFCSSRKQFIGRYEYHHHSPSRKKKHALFEGLKRSKCILRLTIVSYQIESFSSKWELPSWLSPSLITRGRMEARKAALILMKNSHFDRTPQ